MKKPLSALLIASIYFLLAFSVSLAATAETAVSALKKFRSKCEIGISYMDYSNALSDVNYEVKEYLDTNDAKRNPELAKAISDALSFYVDAGGMWRFYFAERYREEINGDSTLWKTFISKYPDAGGLLTAYSYTFPEYKGFKKTGEKVHQASKAFFPEMLSYIWGKAREKIDKAVELMASSPAKRSKKR